MLSRIVAAAVLLLAVLVASPTAPAQARTPESTYQTAITVTTNQARVLRDRVRLRGNRCVQGFAVRQAKRMAAQERMFHQDLGPILEKCGLRKVGENVAYGYLTGVQLVLQGWMQSEGHRANILDRQFRLLGSGARRSEDGTWYAAQVFGRKA
ncbi:CAP domain-containing protein [Nocardioides psychrotolerans]|uniref:CAP domain-containing protein n=1 Tax=Nocardioides psychrotolerans TaxID=1005945 RepID=UPI00313823C2